MAVLLNRRYQIVRRLGGGRDGVVFLAEDTAQGSRLCALKRVRGQSGGAKHARLIGEFQRTSRLDHRCIARVFDLLTVTTPLPGFPLNSLFYTCEFVDGSDPCTSMARLGPGQAAIELLLTVAGDIASALEHLHALGIIHRDVKPGNLLMCHRDGPPRCVLLDLGLSTTTSMIVAGQSAGSPAYMSREAVAGAAEPRSDLYALGATLFETAAGEPPFGALSSAETLRSICEERAPSVGRDAPWLPMPLIGLIDRMLEPEARDRHSCAGELLDDLARVRESIGAAPRGNRPSSHARTIALATPTMCAREAALAAALDAVAAPEVAVVRLVGPSGVGRSTLCREARRRHQLAVAAGRARPVRFISGDAGRLAQILEVPRDISANAVPSMFATALLRRAQAQTSEYRVVLELHDCRGDERALAIERAAAAENVGRSDDTPSVAVVIAAEHTAHGDADASSREILVRPLDDEATRDVICSMVGTDVSPRWCSALNRATGGLPRLVVEAVRAAWSRCTGDITSVAAETLIGRGDVSLARLLEGRIASLDSAQRELLEALAVHRGSASIDALAATVETPDTRILSLAGPLIACGLVEIDQDYNNSQPISLASPAHVQAIHDLLPANRRVLFHRRAAHWRENHGGDAIALAYHRIECGPSAEAAIRCREAAAILASTGRARMGLALLHRVAATAEGAVASRLAADIAKYACMVGDYELAQPAAEKAMRSRSAEVSRRGALLLARARQRAGDADGADAVLRQLRKKAPVDPEVAGTYARFLIARGEFQRAGGVATAPAVRPATSGALTVGAALLLESAGLAALYGGDVAEANQWFIALERRADSSADAGIAGRALGLQGMAAQARGEIASAATLYERAARSARAASDLHAAAVHGLNRASALAEHGRHGEALDAIGAAIAELERLGPVPELPAALYNRSVELLALGELDAAATEAVRAESSARRHGDVQFVVYAQLLIGDVHRRGGANVDAIDHYRSALATACAECGERVRLMARLNLAIALASGGDTEALDQLTRATDEARDGDDRGRLAVAAARVALALGSDLSGCAADLDEQRQRMRATGRRDQAWRAELVAARVADALGDSDRRDRLANAARETFDELLGEAPSIYRAGIAADPDARSLEALAAAPQPAVKTAQRGAEADLRRLLALSRRLNSELRLGPLLDQVIDTVIEMTSAERGFLLLARGEGLENLDIVVARNFEQSALAGEELRLSRSIAQCAAEGGDVVLTVDAAFDERFGASESVAAMRLRSVLAVPLRQKGRVIGTIYLDHRFRAAAFDEHAVELVRELADVAAIAIDNARLTEENLSRQQTIVTLNRALQAEVVEFEAELATTKARLGDAGRDGLRHGYDGIIGRSPPMVEMLRLLDRAADTHLPTVIVGESGTGKELIARALHDNGPRRDGPFVALNCGAVPQELLESELFGHARGAFTGATRDRRGLFEVADGGTLLLDEVADTSLAMQTKLLRVLQEGEIRRVGEDRMRAVNVRVLAASNRALDELVAAGTFREDLYYRLSVLTIAVPPLRDRVADQPALIEHILRAVMGNSGSGMEPPQVTRAARARLAGYAWPGNVRQFENVLARAVALADGVIEVEHLGRELKAATPDHSAGWADGDGARRAGQFELKPRVEALERGLLEGALTETGGNQTAAAKLLGLSRYGLQKKLKRYGINPSACSTQ